MEITKTRMCETGQRLRLQALSNPVFVNSAFADAVSSDAHLPMLTEARRRNDSAAFAAWQEHYRTCETCREALKP